MADNVPDTGQDTESSPAPAFGDSAPAESRAAPAPGAPVAPAVPPPAAPQQPVRPLARPPARRPAVSRGPLWVGLALVFIGVGLLVQMFFPGLRLWAFWPVVLIVWGVLVIVRAIGRD
ncbi:MAG TPA: hypothetical protein VFH17_03400 [Coriobacteriia bacterium]|nr:hypothetical protein [Coriobacteriia bacterium]